MNIYVNGADFSKEIESISWSGDENQLARKVKISYLYAPRSTPAYTRAVLKGDRITLSDGSLIQSLCRTLHMIMHGI